MTSSNLLRRIRWFWTLPVVASAITASLIVVAAYDDAVFWAAHPGISDTPWAFQSPAALLAEALNGPPLFQFPFLGTGWIRLVGVVLFWTWLGRGIDRRLRSEGTRVNNQRFRRIVGNSFMLCIAALFAYGFLTLLHTQGFLPSDDTFRTLMQSSTSWNLKLRFTAWSWYVGLTWSVVYVFYFGVNLLRAVTPAISTNRYSRSALL